MKYEKKSIDKKCVCCGKEFNTSRSYQIFCHKKCATKHYEAQYKAHPQKRSTTFTRLRFKVLERDNFRCQYCGAGPSEKTSLVVDHITPKSKGGTNGMANLITACHHCNGGKSDILLSQKAEKIIRRRIRHGKEM